MEHYVSIGSTKIWTTISNDINVNKPYICLCSGGPGIGDSLFEIDELINSKFNVIRFEQRGCGRSTQDNNYDINTVIDDVEHIRNYYNINSLYLLGHSWGAGIALFYGLKYKAHCNGIVYISGIGIQNDNDWAEEFEKNRQELLEPEIVVPEDFCINFDVTNAGLLSYNQFIKSPTLLRDISKLDIPSIVICGKMDIRPIWPAIQLSNLLPRCNLVILENCNHFPWLQEPQELKEVIFDWVESITK